MALTPPRKVPSREDKYMAIAFWWASCSKDPNTQVGAIIISKDNEPLGTGYNGPPRNVSDTEISWARPQKYDWILHAERNAIKHKKGNLAGSTLYVTGKPCKKCMLDIVDEKIAKVVYFPHKTTDKNSMFSNGEITDNDMTEEIARKGGVELVKFSGNLNWMRDRMKTFESMGIFG